VEPLIEGLLNGLLDKNPNTSITFEEIKVLSPPPPSAPSPSPF
jgi:hypothetical protein